MYKNYIYFVFVPVLITFYLSGAGCNRRPCACDDVPYGADVETYYLYNNTNQELNITLTNFQSNWNTLTGTTLHSSLSTMFTLRAHSLLPIARLISRGYYGLNTRRDFLNSFAVPKLAVGGTKNHNHYNYFEITSPLPSKVFGYIPISLTMGLEKISFTLWKGGKNEEVNEGDEFYVFGYSYHYVATINQARLDQESVTKSFFLYNNISVATLRGTKTIEVTAYPVDFYGIPLPGFVPQVNVIQSGELKNIYSTTTSFSYPIQYEIRNQRGDILDKSVVSGRVLSNKVLWNGEWVWDNEYIDEYYTRRRYKFLDGVRVLDLPWETFDKAKDLGIPQAVLDDYSSDSHSINYFSIFN